MKIAEVSKKLNVSQDTIRYYVRIGLIPHVPRNSGGIREFRDEDLNWIEFIRCMRGSGLSIESLVEYVSLFQQGDETIEGRKEILLEEREKLSKKISEMQSTLERLDYKIKRYSDGLMKKCEDNLIKK